MLIIHKEGITTIIAVIIFLVVINVLYYHFWSQYKIPGFLLTLASTVLLAIVLQFFRNPQREIA